MNHPTTSSGYQLSSSLYRLKGQGIKLCSLWGCAPGRKEMVGLRPTLQLLSAFGGLKSITAKQSKKGLQKMQVKNGIKKKKVWELPYREVKTLGLENRMNCKSP